MIILSSGSTFVEDQKQTASIGEYRMSTFVIKEYIGDDFLLYNTVNGYLLYFYDEVDFMQSISSLIKMWFYVKVDFDEFVWINDMRYNKTICEKDCNISRYTIFTTLNCNARCFYCYEKQQPHLTMSKKTAIDVADYIISNANGANQLIRWFGGEPLFNYDAIDIICQKLKDNNIRFRSRMITNGVLFDKELINRALNLWNLRKVQITLDGTKDVYQRYKRFVDSKGNEFETVLNNIEQLAESGVPVNIRLNQDVNNTENLFQLVELILEKFGHNKLIKVYNSLLYTKNMDKKLLLERYENFLILQDLLIRKKIYPSIRLGKIFKSIHCMADNDKAITILPFGSIGKCEHYTDKYIVGTIYDRRIDKDNIDIWKEKSKVFKECFSCPIYPQCVRISMCPEEKEYCSLLQSENKIYLIKLAMRKLYKKFVSSCNNLQNSSGIR